MLQRAQRAGSRLSQQESQRIKEDLRPNTVRGGGEAQSTPELTEWFDGEKTRAIFIASVTPPTDDYYLPPPVRPPGVSDADFVKGLKEKLKRKIRQIR